MVVYSSLHSQVSTVLFCMHMQSVDDRGDLSVSNVKDPHGQIRFEIGFNASIVEFVNNRWNAGELVIPFWLDGVPNNYSVYIYNTDGYFDCRPPGTAV